ncbi:MAG: helix-turn-helix transcriptional regulator [Acidimicrobiales bacterium]
MGLIASDRSVCDLDQLRRATGHQPRWLQRIFAEYVGIGPKAIIRRYRLQEAADAALSGEPLDWAAKAAQLGYYDQAHLVREFTRVVGMAPAAYARAHCMSANR